MEEPVTIVDREVLKVLSTETRMDIIKELSEGGRTPSDLSKRLNKSDATIVEHLDVLCKAGLVKKTEQPGKKWIFYSLTERGKGIISSKSRRLVIILSTSIIALIGGFITFGQYFQSTNYQMLQSPAAEAGKDLISTIFPSPTFFYLSIALFAISVVGFSVYFLQKSKTKGVGI